MQGRAVDARAQKGSGIDRIDFFLYDRHAGGAFLDSVNPGTMSGPAGPTGFQATLSLPKLIGGHTLFAYAHSTVADQLTAISVPIVLGEDTSKAFGVPPVSQATMTCPL